MWEWPVLDKRGVGENHFQNEVSAKGVERGSSCLHRAWNSSVNTSWARRDLALVRDTKVPLNSGKLWHRTGVKLEDSLRTIVSVWGFLVILVTFPTLINDF